MRYVLTQINQAAASGVYQVVFANNLTGPVRLSSALPDLTQDVRITGPASQMTIRRSSNNAFRIFTVSSTATVRLNNLNLRGGLELYGGAVYNNGYLRLTNVTLWGNRASASSVSGAGGDGGGIFNFGAVSTSATLVVEGGAFYSNRASRNGGGIFNAGNATIADGTAFEHNSAVRGGAIYNSTVAANFGLGASLSVGNGVQIYDNRAVGIELVEALGGGIYNGEYATATITGASITYNTAMNKGGGIFTWGSLDLDAVTLQYNQTPTAIRGKGGAIFVRGGTTRLIADTLVSGNTARVLGNGIARVASATVVVNPGAGNDNSDGTVTDPNP